MKQRIIIMFYINLLFANCKGQENKIDKAMSLPDWKMHTFDYAKQIIPKQIAYSGNNYELTSINLQKTYITKVDNDTVVLAICLLETTNKTESALTYYFISPKTNKRVSDFQPIMTIKGCDYTIPAFVIKDLNKDGRDDFIFLELYNSKCNGNYWIEANFHQIKPKTTGNDLDIYLKLRNDVNINRRIEKADMEILQNKLEVTLAEIFKGG